MSTDPTTTSQVQAYRFMLRRMQSALVRKDAVMLHEPMRHHLRATAVGLILGVFGLVAFFVVGRINPTGDLSANEIVIGDPSGAMFVVQGDPLTLIPVPNETSARLLVATIAPGREAPAAKRVADTALAKLNRLPPTGLPSAPVLPAPENLIKGVWSVCDIPGPRPATTVLVQERAPVTRPLTEDQALLVAEPNTGITYLVWRGVRARVDLRDPAIRKQYQLTDVAPRTLSAGLLGAIPDSRPLTLPAIPPGRTPQILTNTHASTTCLTWQDPSQLPVITLSPEGSLLASGESPVPVRPPAATIQTADFFFLSSGKGALVRGVGMAGQRSSSGAIWLVNDQGFRYEVPSTDVARGLGLGETITPAPEPALFLLPIGDSLDPVLLIPNP
jgi:Type VII secretion system ESX-1, transport TM domain B